MTPVHTAARSDPEESVRRHSGFQGIATFAISVSMLYFGRVVLIPLAAAILLALVLVPGVRLLERWRVGRTMAVVTVMVAGLAVLSCLAFAAGQHLSTTASHWPQYRTAIRTKAGGMVHWMNRFEAYGNEFKDLLGHRQENDEGDTAIHGNGGMPATPADGTQAPLPVRIAPDEHPLLSSLAAYGVDLLAMVGSAVLVLTLLPFLLLRWEDARLRLLMVAGESESAVVDGTLDEAMDRVSRLLLAQSIINAGFGMAAAIGILVIHATLGGHASLATAVTAGMFCALLRFVPYVGIWIGAGIPLLFTLAAYPGSGPFLALLLMFVALELATAQWIEPHWLGAQAGLSPIGVLVSALFWTWLWGPIGLLMSTPLAVVLVVVGKHVRRLRYIHILLADRKQLVASRGHAAEATIV